MENKQEIFKVGDKVFDIRYGWGEVVDTSSYNYIIVQFDIKSVIQYHKDNKVLSFTEYTLQGFSQERPEILPKRGDIVWVRDEDWQPWRIAHFYEKRERGYVVSVINRYDYDYQYKQLTTVNPYNNENDGKQTNNY